MLTDRIAALIARKLSGEASPRELKELADYFQLHPGDQYFEELLNSYWQSKPESYKEDSSDEHVNYLLLLAGQDVNAAQTDVPEVSNRGGRVRLVVRRLSIAAIFAGVSFIVWKLAFPDRTQEVKQQPQNEVTAKRGTKSRLLLPDGSQVWLNSDSRLVYSNSFSDSIREVELEGEAYFDVVKDAKRPFIVHTSSIDIRVLGTAFNVKSYATESTIEATLIRGIIEVIRKNAQGAPHSFLYPHQKFVLNKAEDTVAQGNANLPASKTATSHAASSVIPLPKNIPDSSITETFWVYNKLSFDGEEFGEVAVKMERWFNVIIRFSNDKVKKRRLHVSFLKNETIEEALQNIKLSIPFNYTRNGNDIEIY